MTEPASIRTKNPGAMWGRVGQRPSADRRVATNAPIPKKWGSKTTLYLNDGMGQGNNIAEFENYVDGICAQLDLWRSKPVYRNKRFDEAIAVWSGGNHVESYIQYVFARVPGMTRGTIMNDAFWRSPMGLQFLKAQAGHEAGKPYPAPGADWIEAQRRVFASVSATRKKVAAAVATNTATATVAAQAHSSGASITTVLIILGIGIAASAIAWYVIHKRAP